MRQRAARPLLHIALIMLLAAPGLSLAITLQTGLNGPWYEPQTDGQGIILHVIPEANQIFMVWFTYSPDGSQQMWLTASGTLDQQPVSLTFTQPGGGQFNATLPAVTQAAWGSGAIEFASCQLAELTYNGPDGLSGSVQLQRLTPVIDCQEGD